MRPAIVVMALALGCTDCKRSKPEGDLTVLLRYHALLTERKMGEGGRDLTDAEIADAHVRCERSPAYADECTDIDRLHAQVPARLK